ncbi:hypothetical protein F2Q70_00023969 [Brassica cretica]|uniref:Uncharacterized protein n=1 Tax=Brassica cretica TaxID=69181 RepID=A0A8S9GRZ1_BRACR|nr:hypothetical protein F2Q70_00023969 [Brassica cretica]
MEERGLHNVVEDLLRRSKNVASSKSHFVSLIEVRQELIKDLLVSNSRRLQIEKRKGYGFDHSTYSKGGSTVETIGIFSQRLIFFFSSVMDFNSE